METFLNITLNKRDMKLIYKKVYMWPWLLTLMLFWSAKVDPSNSNALMSLRYMALKVVGILNKIEELSGASTA